MNLIISISSHFNHISIRKLPSSFSEITMDIIGEIGEQMVNIDDHLEDEYKDLRWKAIRNMRNIIVHVYDKVKAEVVYEIATKDLESLENSLLKIKADLEERL